jgi:hypothetical protein
LDRVLEQASIQLDLKANRLLYRRFVGSSVHSNIVLRESGIDLQDVSINHAGGFLKVKGTIDQRNTVNQFSIASQIKQVNLTQLFYAFENFGQDALAYQNLRGGLNSTANVSGLIRDNGQIVPKSFSGSVSFDIKDGAIVNFEPMEKVGKFAFPNRNFSNITFSKLKNTIDIKGDKINIRPMYIESSVLNLYVEGTYGIPTGTDIALRIPIRNPKRDIGLSDSLKRERFDNGIVINLRGQDDENGTVKFKLGKKDEDDEKEEAEEREKKEEKEKQKALRRAEEKKEKQEKIQ